MIRVRQVDINIEEDNTNILIKKCSSKLNIKSKDIKNIKINKKSIDARHKPDIYYSYTVDIEVDNEEQLLKRNRNKDILKTPTEKYEFNITGNKELKNKIIIVGSGPCGIFAAYILAQNGYKPLIIERGSKVEERIIKVEEFFKCSVLDENTNIQFGEGGAGTFSDGKLNTMVKDKAFRQQKVFEIFVENGAPKEILYENKPHIGTNILREVIKNMRNNIIKMGGEFSFNTKLTNIIYENNKLAKIEINNKKTIPCNILILAIGHSARDTFKMLYDNKINMCQKPFAIGLRVEHNQETINKSQYGENYNKKLPAASYKLTYTTKSNHGVYSFCMCPGGYVVNASSEEGCLAVNGMSNHERESGVANSAIIVTVSKDNFGEGVLAGIKFQKELEQKAYSLAKGKIPLQLYKDFKENKESDKFGKIIPKTKGEYSFANLRKLLSETISIDFIEAMENFNNKIKGFAADDVVLAGIESRTSSPVRIIRDENFNSNIEGIFPAGEGAGYAGGITSAAIDGLKVAEKIAAIYKN